MQLVSLYHRRHIVSRTIESCVLKQVAKQNDWFLIPQDISILVRQNIQGTWGEPACPMLEHCDVNNFLIHIAATASKFVTKLRKRNSSLIDIFVKHKSQEQTVQQIWLASSTWKQHNIWLRGLTDKCHLTIVSDRDVNAQCDTLRVYI